MSPGRPALSPGGQRAHLSWCLPFPSDANFTPSFASHPGPDGIQAQQILSQFTLQASSSLRRLPTQSWQPGWPFAHSALSSHGQQHHVQSNVTTPLRGHRSVTCPLCSLPWHNAHLEVAFPLPMPPTLILFYLKKKYIPDFNFSHL